MPSLAVFTRDLRIHDNPMLAAAGEGVVPVFVSDPGLAERHGSPNRQAFLAEALADLDESLRGFGSRLVHRHGPWLETVTSLATEIEAESIHVARDVSAYAQSRLDGLHRETRVPVIEHDILTVVAPDALETGTGTPYKVFTPYHRRWLDAPRRAIANPPGRMAAHAIPSHPLPEPDRVGTSRYREHGGETAALANLDSWLDSIDSYDDARDRLAAPTSRVSAALHFGTLSPLMVEQMAADLGADGYVRQLAWRDFNHQALYHHPSWSSSDIRRAGRAWLDDEEGFAAWTTGTTGYPLVDAAMRQLIATGWIHNRARMVAASFLTKHLMIDWRRGARWFLTWLTDGDIANNHLNWQWVAGTGLDATPWRMLNPSLQSQRHDPHGIYIRRWIPELADVRSEDVHDPPPPIRRSTGYPAPIIDHRVAVGRYKGRSGS